MVHGDAPCNCNICSLTFTMPGVGHLIVCRTRTFIYITGILLQFWEMLLRFLKLLKLKSEDCLHLRVGFFYSGECVRPVFVFMYMESNLAILTFIFYIHGGRCVVYVCMCTVWAKEGKRAVEFHRLI
jgi:hypothetical protein